MEDSQWNWANVIGGPFEADEMQDPDEPTTLSIRARMEAYIRAASESMEIDCIDFGTIDELATKFVDSLTPKEMGFLMYDDPQPLSLQEVDSDITEKYRAKYGTKNLKRGQFFKLESGTITFLTHEHNLKFKVGN